jgi:hypothetical protein
LAFDADQRVRQPLAAAGKAAVIPPRDHRCTVPNFDRELYKERHLIENFFFKLKQVPRHRYALRQNRPKFPRRHPPRRRYHLAQLTTRLSVTECRRSCQNGLAGSTKEIIHLKEAEGSGRGRHAKRQIGLRPAGRPQTAIETSDLVLAVETRAKEPPPTPVMPTRKPTPNPDKA